jgi:uncharacterized protein YndB with AHSA1/START domain
MPLLLGALLAVAALVAALLAIGWLLPVRHVCARSAVFRQPPEAVWALITDPAGFPAWRKDVRGVEMLAPVQGRARWKESGGERPLTFEVVSSAPLKRLVTRIADTGLPFGGTWTFDLVPDGDGCRLSIRENGEIYNVFFRFMARFAIGYHRTLEAYLRAVGAKYGETARPEVAPTWG